MSGLHRSARHSEPHHAGFIQSDEGEEQPHTHREAVAQRGGHAFHHPLPQMQDGHEHKQHARDEDGGQRRLPAHSQNLADGERDKRVLAHVRGDGKGTVGVKRHQVAAEWRRPVRWR